MESEKGTLAEDISKIMEVVGYIQKDKSNKFHKYNYASANAVFTKVREQLSHYKIAIERDEDRSEIVWISEEGTYVIYNWVGRLVRGEESLSMCGMGGGSDKNDKGVMKAQTAALKYAVSGTFLISWGDDPEAEEDEDVPSAKAGAAPKTKAPPKPPAEGAKAKPAANIALIIEKIGEAKSLDELEVVANVAKTKMSIAKADRPALRKAYTDRKKELENE